MLQPSFIRLLLATLFCVFLSPVWVCASEAKVTLVLAPADGGPVAPTLRTVRSARPDAGGTIVREIDGHAHTLPPGAVLAIIQHPPEQAALTTLEICRSQVETLTSMIEQYPSLAGSLLPLLNQWNELFQTRRFLLEDRAVRRFAESMHTTPLPTTLLPQSVLLKTLGILIILVSGSLALILLGVRHLFTVWKVHQGLILIGVNLAFLLLLGYLCWLATIPDLPRGTALEPLPVYSQLLALSTPEQTPPPRLSFSPDELNAFLRDELHLAQPELDTVGALSILRQRLHIASDEGTLILTEVGTLLDHPVTITYTIPAGRGALVPSSTTLGHLPLPSFLSDSFWNTTRSHIGKWILQFPHSNDYSLTSASPEALVFTHKKSGL